MNPAFARHQELPRFDRQNPPVLPSQFAAATRPAAVQGKFVGPAVFSESGKSRPDRGAVSQQTFPAEESPYPSSHA